MFCRHVLEIIIISGGFCGISRFGGISRKNLNFAGPRPRKISEVLTCSDQWLDLDVLQDACHELFCVFGDFY